MKRATLLIFSLLIWSFTMAGAAPTQPAQWIWQPGVKQVNCWMRFRKPVVLDSASG
jgi:hypothetical protein